jgi:hypothetical protein
VNVTQDNGFSIPDSGTAVVRLLTFPFTTGAFPLIDYAGAIQGGAVADHLRLAALPPRVTALLSNNTANTSVDLAIANPGEPIRWTGASGADWDVSLTTNWLTQNTLVAST